jgi:predicted dehydrogenase
MIDQAVVLFGMPDAVFAAIDKVRDHTKVDDYYHIQLLYPQVKVSLRASFLVREETPRYYIHGTEGSFVKYGIDPQEEMLKVGISPSLADWGKEPESQWGILHTSAYRGKVETERGNYLAFYDEIYQTMRFGKPSSTAASEVIKVIRIIEAAFESSQNKKVVFL